jgi:hypothetical protein
MHVFYNFIFLNNFLVKFDLNLLWVKNLLLSLLGLSNLIEILYSLAKMSRFRVRVGPGVVVGCMLPVSFR